MNNGVIGNASVNLFKRERVLPSTVVFLENFISDEELRSD